MGLSACASSASISSPTTIVPSSAAIDAPAKPVSRGDERPQLSEHGDADDVGDLIRLAELVEGRLHLEREDQADARAHEHHDAHRPHAHAHDLRDDRGVPEAHAPQEERPADPPAHVDHEVRHAADEREGIDPDGAPRGEEP
jgi:hypothetical protein